MADLALGGLERIFKACMAIKKAVATVKQNKKECRDIQRCVGRVTALLSWLQELTMGMVINQAFSGPLDDLADSMEEALELITDCQQKSAVRHLLTAGDMAKKLGRVHDDILRKLAVASFSSNILQISVSVTQTLHYVGAHPPPLLPQGAGEVDTYDSNLNVTEMRPGVNSNTEMVPTENAMPYASPSRLTELNSSKWESSLHLSSEENITAGGHALVLKQKIVIKLEMASVRSRINAMKLVAASVGVESLSITGDGKDQMVVVGQGMDAVMLTNRLRKKVGMAALLMVGEAQEQESPLSSSPSDSGEESPLSSSPAPRPAAFEGSSRQWKKQTLPLLAAQPHEQGVVAAHARPGDGGPSPRGIIMAHLRAAAAGLKESGHTLHESLLVPPAYGIILAFVFLLFLKTVTSST